MTTASKRKALHDLFKWMTGPEKTGNPYMHAPVTAAILALTQGSSRYDKPERRPKSKIDSALYDLVELATTGNRQGNPYMKPAVRAASIALGGDGYDIPSKQKASRSSHATKRDRAAELIENYKPWSSAYSNEDLDRAQGLANRLTAIDREEGRSAPAVGYSAKRYEQAKQVVSDANQYGAKQQSLRAKGQSHARKKKITHHEAKRLLEAEGIDFTKDVDATISSMSKGNRVAEVARLAGYRKSKNAPGSTSRMYFHYLSRLRNHATRQGKHTIYDLIEVNTRTKKERVLHKHFSTKADAKEAADEYKARKRPDVTYRVRSRQAIVPPYRWNLED